MRIMRRKTLYLILAAAMSSALGLLAFSCVKASASDSRRYDFPDIFDVSYTPDTLHRSTGWFTDAGAWFGFTAPEKRDGSTDSAVPFSLDMNRREWLAKSAVVVSPVGADKRAEGKDSVCYYPGELVMSSAYGDGAVKPASEFHQFHVGFAVGGKFHRSSHCRIRATAGWREPVLSVVATPFSP